MSVRLNKATKECNVGLKTAVEFLQKKGYEAIEENPNAKITEEQYEVLLKQFAPDKVLRSEAKQISQQRQEQNRERKEASKAQKTEVFVGVDVQVEAPKVLGRINLDAKGNPKQEPKPEPKPQPKVGTIPGSAPSEFCAALTLLSHSA